MTVVISDGTRSLTVPLSNDGNGFWVKLEGLSMPVPANNDVFAESADGDGQSRIRSRKVNAEGVIALNVGGTSSADFWDNLDELQEIVEAAHARKGTIKITLPNYEAATFDLEGMAITELPLRGVMLSQNVTEAEITFTCKPFSRFTQDWIQGLTVLNSNPDFETNTTGWTTSTATLTRVTTDFHTGTACGQVVVSSSNNRGFYNTTVVTVSASTRYSAHCYVKAASASDVGKVVYLRLEELTSGSVNVGQTETRVSLTREWQKVRVSRLFGGTGVRARVHMLNYTSGAVTWLVDDIRLFASEVLTGPIDWFQVANVDGHVPALGALSLFDTSSQARNHVEVGLQANFDPNNAEPVHLAAVTDITALAGSSTTRAGSNSTNVLRASVGTNPVAIGTSGSRTHKGLWRFRARVYVSAATVSCRLSWRIGAGTWTDEKWVRVPAASGWYDLDLGVVNIPELPTLHSAEFRVMAISSSGLPTVDLDYLEPVPADNWTRLRGLAVTTSQSGLVAYDDFSTQTSGAVTGKTPQLVPAGSYSGAGDTDDFQVDTTLKCIYRTAASDSALNNGRYLRCGSSAPATTIAQVDVKLSWYMLSGTNYRMGLFIRYVDTNNWLGLFYKSVNEIELRKRVAGTETVLGSAIGAFGDWRTLLLACDAAGNISALHGPQGSPLEWLFVVLADSNLATAGALDDGGYGIYDSTTESSPVTRYYDNFQVQTPSSTSSLSYPALSAGRGADLFDDSAIREDSTGTSVGTVPIVEGEYLTVPPATRAGRYSRIVVRARRNDLELGLPDEGLSDVLTADLDVAPRRLIT